MRLDEDDMVSASELNRNPARYVSRAMQGWRPVIIRDNVPVAALIGMDDLRRLDSLDNEEGSRPPQVVVAPDSDDVGITVIGTDDHGAPVSIPLCANHLIVGASGAGKTVAASAAIAGARPAHPLKFLIVTTGMPFPLTHPVTDTDNIAVTDERPWSDDGTLWTLVRAVTESRASLLAEHQVASLAELRERGVESDVADLVIIVDSARLRGFGDNLAYLRCFGVYLWAFQNQPPDDPPYTADDFDSRIALRTLAPYESKVLINSRDAYTVPRNQQGLGYLQTTAKAATHLPIKFRFTAPQHFRDRAPDIPPLSNAYEAAVQLGILPPKRT